MTKLSLGQNISSLAAQRGLNRASEEMARSFERLASGQRINRASDDAAGLAIAASLNAQGRVFAQAIKNVNDGVSALSIAEGAVHQLTGILQRQMELATQSANGTYGTKQRQALQLESNQLTSEFNRIIATTSFNGMSLLDGTSRSIELQVGSNGLSSSRIQIDLSGLLATSTATSGGGSITTADSGTAEVTTLDFTNSMKLESVTFFTDFASSYAAGDHIAFSVVEGNTVVEYYAWLRIDGAGSDPGLPGTAIVVDLLSSYNSDDVGFALQAAINGATPWVNVNYTVGGSFELSNSQHGNVPDAFGSILFSPSWTQGASFETGDYIEFSSTSGDYYVWYQILGDSGGDPGLAGRTGIMVTIDPIDDGWTIASSTASAIESAIPELNASQSNYITNIGNTVNGVVNTPPSASVSSTVGVSVTTAGTPSEISPTLDTISIASHGYSTGQQLQVSTSGVLPGGLTAGTYYAIKVDDSTIKLATSASNALAGTAVNLSNYGTGTLTLTPPGVVTTTTYNPYISNLDLSSQAGSRTALDTISTQMQMVTNTLGSIGASQSRLTSAIQSLAVARENTYTAAARIQSIDYASEAANLTKNRILRESAAAVLAQANSTPQLVIKLLSQS